jgi:hypothetical protein
MKLLIMQFFHPPVTYCFSVRNRRYNINSDSRNNNNLSCRARLWGLFQPLTEMSIRSVKLTFPGSKVRRVHRADNLTAICEPIVYKIWDP